MTTTNNHRAARRSSRGERSRLEPALVHGDQACMQPDEDYRQLEQSYHHSAQYAAMVQRYPVLQHAIETYRKAELVGDQQSLLAKVHGPQLHWQRSHGEP